MAWPPTLDELKTDMKIGLEDDRDDERLTQVLAAAVAWVQRNKAGRYDFAGDPTSPLEAPGTDIELGTLRLAARWHTRRRSPDGLVQVAQEMGSNRVPSFDPDIDRLLGIGRYAPITFA